ncbi:hypothetical protein [Limosilactobacillus vaginalis]|uniref:hypothetical protein n=1 Tax=Limosilactobacillus vaginalis TaxID=1633 RepID=UPI00242BBDDF|nr:hypothetical protein [Limosilactobacillus vaginalis]
MKINKYIEELENNGFEVYEDNTNGDVIKLIVWYGDFKIARVILGNNVRNLKLDGDTNLPLQKLIDFLMRTKSLIDTPDNVLFTEPKYRVRLVGFNSQNGKQYLTTEQDNSNPLGHKFFACALREGLKQEFTLDELTAIANKREFKAVPWIQDLLRNIELVEDD